MTPEASQKNSLHGFGASNTSGDGYGNTSEQTWIKRKQTSDRRQLWQEGSVVGCEEGMDLRREEWQVRTYGSVVTETPEENRIWWTNLRRFGWLH
ncbi:hypothetical protein BSKO_07713 [Bryopsis sp. KO-2023]|nr:hypothetical protein BSKO_07713 [Bryopsis sp. KO-2023]